MATKKAILGVFDNHTQAGNVVAQLRLRGFPMSFISILFPDEPSAACAGGAMGFFSNIRAMSLLGIGAVIAGGALTGMLRGGPGGLVDCLIGQGINVLEARQCERDLRAGKILVAVHVEHPRFRSVASEVLTDEAVASVDTLDEHTAPYERAA